MCCCGVGGDGRGAGCWWCGAGCGAVLVVMAGVLVVVAVLVVMAGVLVVVRVLVVMPLVVVAVLIVVVELIISQINRPLIAHHI